MHVDCVGEGRQMAMPFHFLHTRLRGIEYLSFPHQFSMILLSCPLLHVSAIIRPTFIKWYDTNKLNLLVTKKALGECRPPTNAFYIFVR